MCRWWLADLNRSIFWKSISMLVSQLEEGRAEVENQYARSVNQDGNLPAQNILREVFEVSGRQWRGIGPIAQSGYRLREEFADFDAERIFGVEDWHAEEPKECISALVLQGLKKPVDCPAFGKRCTPMTPLGAPMVSSRRRLRRLLPIQTPCLRSPETRCGNSLRSSALPRFTRRDRIVLGHGSGGQTERRAFARRFPPAVFKSRARPDG